jgi:hypothetical protein
MLHEALQADERLDLGQVDVVLALALLRLEPTNLDPMTERPHGHTAARRRLVARQHFR